MAQATLDDDDLFDEAADEIRDDVHEHLDTLEAALPDPESIWEAESENVLGVLNTLRTNLEPDELDESLREAKKWHSIGIRADVFEEDDETSQRIAEFEETVERIDEVREQVGELAGVLPDLRERLDDARTEADVAA